MKSITLISLLFLACIGLNAQTRPSDKLFEKMALKPGISLLSFSKGMLDAVNMNFDDDNDDVPESHNVTGDLHEIKVMIYTAPEEETPIDFRKEILRYLPVGTFKVIEPDEHDIHYDEGSCDIRVHKNGRKINECHILFKGETNGMLLSFFGDFRVEDVKALAEKAEDYK